MLRKTVQRMQSNTLGNECLLIYQLKVFSSFLRYLHQSRISLLRSLQLHINEHAQRIWERGAKIVRSMRGLTSLDLIAHSGMSKHDAHRMITHPAILEDTFSFLLFFRILPLQHVRVALQHRGYIDEDCWTEQDRTAIAEIIQDKIANSNRPRGHRRVYPKRQEVAKASKLADMEEAEAKRAERHRKKQEKGIVPRS